MGKPSQGRLLELFSDEGHTIRRRVAKGKAKAGSLIRSRGNHGYYRVRVDGEYYLVHQLLWRMRTGDWPERIDHRNGCLTDNTEGNLRLASHSENMQNTKVSARNTSGHRGVSRHSCGRWQVQVSANGVPHYGGLFANFNDACNRADELRRELHGEFAGEVYHRQENQEATQEDRPLHGEGR